MTLVGLRHVEEKNIEGGWKNFTIIKQGGELKDVDGDSEFLTYANHEGYINRENVAVLKEMKVQGNASEKVRGSEFNAEIQKIITGNPGTVDETREDTRDFLEQVKMNRLIELSANSKASGYRGAVTNACIHNFGRHKDTGHEKMWMVENDLAYYTAPEKEPGSVAASSATTTCRAVRELVFMGWDVYTQQRRPRSSPSRFARASRWRGWKRRSTPTMSKTPRKESAPRRDHVHLHGP